MELTLPAPCVVVLVGPSGSGKSTWARDHFTSSEIVSSDSLRAVVGIDEDDLAASTAAFELLDTIVGERLRRSLTTVIDTTGLDPDRRVKWVENAHDVGLPVYAILFETDIGTIEQANSHKLRPVPKSALRKQLSRFNAAVREVGDEGFDGVHSQQAVRAVPTSLVSPLQQVEPPQTGHTFGLLVSRFDWATPELGSQLTSIAARAEEAGFTDLWLMDHFRQIQSVGRPWEDIPEAMTALAYVAATTTSIRLGVLVNAITHRHPVVLGKMMATLDVLSGGRAICGLGVGWDQDEHSAYGIDMPSVTERYERLEDTLKMLPLLWGKGTPSFKGKTFSAAELACYPRPIQDPIPILIGGSGEKKTLRLVARYADACNLFGSPETVKRKVEVLEGHCESLERDATDVTVTHLTNAMAGANRTDLRDRVNRLRGRNTTVEDFSKRHNAGLVPDLVNLFDAYAAAGAEHSIVALPDVHLDGSIESFSEVIATFDRS